MGAKFKAGDRVRRPNGEMFSNGEPVVTVGERRTDCGDPYFVETDTWHFSSCLELVTPATTTDPTNDNSPIRTVTRREIVGGTVCDFTSGAFLTPTDVRPDGTIAFDICGGFDAASLRKAARIFNEIADVLDEQSATGEAA